MSVLATSLAFASPASADYANSGVYAVAPQWGGFCPGYGNYATWVYYINFTTGNQWGDSGDDIVWMRVVNGRPNLVHIGVQCRWSTPIGADAWITPTRYGQAWWFSVWGQTWHN
jgi:hypothetical protein